MCDKRQGEYREFRIGPVDHAVWLSALRINDRQESATGMRIADSGAPVLTGRFTFSGWYASSVYFRLARDNTGNIPARASG